MINEIYKKMNRIIKDIIDIIPDNNEECDKELL